jgi:hypothetical protein
VTAALDAAGTALVLTLPAAARGATGDAQIVAARGFFANWPLVALRGANGLPAEPWLLDATGVANACPPPTAGDDWSPGGADDDLGSTRRARE